MSEQNLVSERIAEIRHNREVSPREAAQKIYDQKLEAANQIKKEQRIHEKYINQQRYQDFHLKIVRRSRVQKDLEEGH